MTVIYIIIAVVFVWFSLRYAWWARSIDYRFPRILMYHMVKAHKPDGRFNGLRVTTDHFESQMKWLHDNGWSSYTVSEMVDGWSDLPAKSVAITFDDGYEDNFLNALPILKKYNIKATIYLVVDRFDRDWSVSKKSHHNSGELKDEPKLTNEQVMELLDSGMIELGSHTLTHPDFSKQPVAEKKKELVESKRLLEDAFNVAIRSFAYPFGIYSADDRSLVNEVHYSSAVTTNPGIDMTMSPDYLELKRIKISGKDNMLAFKTRMRRGIRGWKK